MRRDPNGGAARRRSSISASMDVRSMIRSRSREVNVKSSRCSGLIRFGGIIRDWVVGAGYSLSLERERLTGAVQFSTVSPFTRPNSAVLFVTSLSARLRACAAMKRSLAPII